MNSVREGNLDKMSLLFSRNYRSLYIFLYHMTHDKADSEDMVQNTFYRMLKYRHSYSGAGSFQTWMYHIARNVLKDHVKKRHTMPISDKMEWVAETLTDEKTAGDQLEKKQDKLELHNAIGLLKSEEREVLIMSKFQELKYQQIATILGITEGAVKVKVHRALNELKLIYQRNKIT